MPTRILYAAHDDGRDLAVIDVTNPAFAVTVTDAELAVMADRYLVELAQQAQMAPAVHAALQQSELGRAIAAASDGFLGCLPTYLLKLGPENLGVWETSPIDRHIASSFPALALRMRLQDMARLLADGLAGMAAAQPQRRVCLVNIAGGLAADSWNALVLLHAEQPGLLDGRAVAIAVLDRDEQGPAFAARAVAALCGQAAPLSGLDIRLEHFSTNGPMQTGCGSYSATCLQPRQRVPSLQRAVCSSMDRMRRLSPTLACFARARHPMPWWWAR